MLILSYLNRLIYQPSRYTTIILQVCWYGPRKRPWRICIPSYKVTDINSLSCCIHHSSCCLTHPNISGLLLTFSHLWMLLSPTYHYPSHSLPLPITYHAFTVPFSLPTTRSLPLPLSHLITCPSFITAIVPPRRRSCIGRHHGRRRESGSLPTAQHEGLDRRRRRRWRWWWWWSWQRGGVGIGEESTSKESTSTAPTAVLENVSQRCTGHEGEGWLCLPPSLPTSLAHSLTLSDSNSYSSVPTNKTCESSLPVGRHCCTDIHIDSFTLVMSPSFRCQPPFPLWTWSSPPPKD